VRPGGGNKDHQEAHACQKGQAAEGNRPPDEPQAVRREEQGEGTEKTDDKIDEVLDRDRGAQQEILRHGQMQELVIHVGSPDGDEFGIERNEEDPDEPHGEEHDLSPVQSVKNKAENQTHREVRKKTSQKGKSRWERSAAGCAEDENTRVDASDEKLAHALR
jgi:hypothetical protein